MITPGTWTYSHDADGDYVILAGGKIVAITDHDRPEDEDNARLIIAAPAMLSVLKRIVANPEARIGGHIRAEAIVAIRLADSLSFGRGDSE